MFEKTLSKTWSNMEGMLIPKPRLFQLGMHVKIMIVLVDVDTPGGHSELAG